MRSLLLVESFDLRPSNQYILVKVIPSCFRFAKMCFVPEYGNLIVGYQPLTSNRNENQKQKIIMFLGSKLRQARRAENLSAICEPTV
jgi:hypothetical protein